RSDHRRRGDGGLRGGRTRSTRDHRAGDPRPFPRAGGYGHPRGDLHGRHAPLSHARLGRSGRGDPAGRGGHLHHSRGCLRPTVRGVAPGVDREPDRSRCHLPGVAHRASAHLGRTGRNRGSRLRHAAVPGRRAGAADDGRAGARRSNAHRAALRLKTRVGAVMLGAIVTLTAAAAAGWIAQPWLTGLVRARTGPDVTPPAPGRIARWTSRPMIAAGSAIAGTAGFAPVPPLLLAVCVSAGLLGWWLACIDLAIHRLPDPLVGALAGVFALGYALLYLTGEADL